MAMEETRPASAEATKALATFAAETPCEAVPEVVRDRMKECFLDFIGNSSFAANHAESSPAFRAGVIALSEAEGPGTVVGDGRGYPFQYAALLNGAYAHTLDFDDTNILGGIHPGAAVLPAAMAAAQRCPSSGREFIAAQAVGFEVACRVGAAIGPSAYDRGFHNTPIAGIFGAIAAAGRLRGFDAEALANAFGLGGSQASGSMQYLVNGAWNKRLHPGLAAHDALVALAFVEAGVIGAGAAIEGRYGMLTGYSNEPRPEQLLERLGSWWAAAETALKPYPSCRLAHAAIDAALALRNHLPEERRSAAALELLLSPKAVQIVGEPDANKLRPNNIVEGQFSVFFQVACAWLDGKCEWQSYQRLGDEDINAMAGRIAVEADPELPIAGAVLSLADGSVPAQRIMEPLGEPGRPMSWAEVEGKYDGLAIPVYGATVARRIADRVRRLEDEPLMADLIDLLAKPGI